MPSSGQLSDYEEREPTPPAIPEEGVAPVKGCNTRDLGEPPPFRAGRRSETTNAC